MCDRLAALDGFVLPASTAAVVRSTPSSPNAYRAIIQQQQQQQQLEKTASVPDLLQQQNKRRGGNERPRVEGDDDDGHTAEERHAALASACIDSKSDGCLTETGRAPVVTSLSGTFLCTSPCKVNFTNKALYYNDYLECASPRSIIYYSRELISFQTFLLELIFLQIKNISNFIHLRLI